jgi:nicotinamidase-related amidase
LNPQPKDHKATKQTWGAFTNTGLEAYLKESGITQMVIDDLATSVASNSLPVRKMKAGQMSRSPPMR